MYVSEKLYKKLLKMKEGDTLEIDNYTIIKTKVFCEDCLLWNHREHRCNKPMLTLACDTSTTPWTGFARVDDLLET